MKRETSTLYEELLLINSSLDKNAAFNLPRMLPCKYSDSMDSLRVPLCLVTES